MPPFVSQYFWGDSIQDLDIDKHKTYIVMTLLEHGDSKAIHWLFSHIPKEMVKSLLPTLKLSKKSANYWSLCL